MTMDIEQYLKGCERNAARELNPAERYQRVQKLAHRVALGDTALAPWIAEMTCGELARALDVMRRSAVRWEMSRPRTVIRYEDAMGRPMERITWLDRELCADPPIINGEDLPEPSE